MAMDGTSYVDEPGTVRSGEELDETKLREFLAKAVPDARGRVQVSQYRRGFSNLTYMIQVGHRQLVLRRPPIGAKIKTAHDMGREYRILSMLDGVYPMAPRPIAYCEDASVLGAPFYVMDRIMGIILRGDEAKSGLKLQPDTMRGLSTALIDNLAKLHTVDVHATGLISLGHPEGYVERQVRGWIERYEGSKTDDISEMDQVAGWLVQHIPAEQGAALIHNDYKYDNLVVEPENLCNIVGVLDWEMATVGDPWMDVGTALGYWVDPNDDETLRALPVGPTILPGNLRRIELVERYARASGRETPAVLFYYVYALFKIAVIAQQIYKRFKIGLTKDPRFGMLLSSVRILGQQASRAIGKERIYDLS